MSSTYFTHTHTCPHTYTHAHTLSLSLSLSFFLTHPRTHTTEYKWTCLDESKINNQLIKGKCNFQLIVPGLQYRPVGAECSIPVSCVVYQLFSLVSV